MRVKPLNVRDFGSVNEISKWARECPALKYFVATHKPTKEQLLDFIGRKDPSPIHIRQMARTYRIPITHQCIMCSKIAECGLL